MNRPMAWTWCNPHDYVSFSYSLINDISTLNIFLYMLLHFFHNSTWACRWEINSLAAWKWHEQCIINSWLYLIGLFNDKCSERASEREKFLAIIEMFFASAIWSTRCCRWEINFFMNLTDAHAVRNLPCFTGGVASD